MGCDVIMLSLSSEKHCKGMFFPANANGFFHLFCILSPDIEQTSVTTCSPHHCLLQLWSLLALEFVAIPFQHFFPSISFG